MSRTEGLAELHRKLDEIYYDSADPGSFGGVSRLYRRAKELGIPGITLARASRYLSDQQSYSLHKPARRNFRRNKTVVGHIDQQWQADLADMQGLAKENEGYKYLLTVIDVFSKYAWVIPVKNKSASAILAAFQELFNRQAKPRKPKRIQTDAGKEFLNTQLQNYLREQNILHFHSASDKKAAVVERFNRTLKHRLWAYFTANQTYAYTPILQNIVNAYNHSHHRTLGMAPAEVRIKDELRLFRKMFPEALRSKVKRSRAAERKKYIEPGKMVRVSKVKGHFEKGYMPNWSEENFYVSSKRNNKKRTGMERPLYELRDKGGEDIKGSWYSEELQPIEKNRYLIEKIIRKRKGRKLSGNSSAPAEVLVKWKGWPAKFNTWIPADDLIRIKKNEDV